jgi:uncharacterized repeat protein (TIGR03803 family)
MRSRFVVATFALTSAMLLASSSRAQTVTPLYSFAGTSSSGNPAYGALVQGRDGKLYGTSSGEGGADGSAFRITTGGFQDQFYTFGAEGITPYGSLTLGNDGNFYGTTGYGGSADNGVLFKLSPEGTYTVLHEFQGGSDGANPLAAPIQASDSNFYGTTSGTTGASTVYRYETNGTFTTILNLDSAQGQYVVAPLIEGSDGNLYGVAAEGGNAYPDDCGTVFKLSTSGQMLWTYAFPCGSNGNRDGDSPYAPLIQASDGNYYGTALAGGYNLGGCCGVIFKLTHDGHVSVLFAFDYLDGGQLFAGLTQGSDGNLYGAASVGGDKQERGGTLFQISLSGTYKVLYNFGVAENFPTASLAQDTNGTFYGTTYWGGSYSAGTVYSLNMGLGPFITFVQPTGAIGATAQILGQGLTGTTAVTFNGVAATSFTAVNDTYMTAVVPSGATTGKVVVTTPDGALTSNVNFRIIN